MSIPCRPLEIIPISHSRIDVTEGQLLCIGVFILTSVVGLRFWNWAIPLIGLKLFHLTVLAGENREVRCYGRGVTGEVGLSGTGKL